eukprot:4152236-Lingulodinium_polyedra.AAC.1
MRLPTPPCGDICATSFWAHSGAVMRSPKPASPTTHYAHTAVRLRTRSVIAGPRLRACSGSRS